jgi:prephenate dehydrogenase
MGAQRHRREAMKTLGIIGYGAFGRLAAAQLTGRYVIKVHDEGVKSAVILLNGHQPAGLAETASSDVVLIAVPVQAMESVIAATSGHVRPGATVIDVASVKLLPSQWLAEYIPPSTHIVATHPLFGPQSTARGGLSGRQLVICPIRGDQHLKVAALGEELGLRVRFTTADEHDREMAYVQALTHLIGRSLAQMKIPDEELKTQSYQHLIDLTELIGSDSFELFSAIQTMNPHASAIVADFVARAQALLVDVASRPDSEDP